MDTLRAEAPGLFLGVGRRATHHENVLTCNAGPARLYQQGCGAGAG